jgi:type IV fimbrial biogenesis protein FimT
MLLFETTEIIGLNLIQKTCIDFVLLTSTQLINMSFKNANSRAQRTKSLVRGFSLIEVMVAIAILGVLISIAMPSFTATIRRYRAEAIRDDLTASLQIARSEAIRRGLSNTITITRTPASGTCTADTAVAGQWSCGWQIFIDANNNNVFDDGAANLIQQSEVPTGFSVIETSAVPTNFAIVNRWGQFNSAQRFVISPFISSTATPSDPSANALCLGVGGVVTRIKQTTGDVACP